MSKTLWFVAIGLGVVSIFCLLFGLRYFLPSDWVALLAAALIAAVQLAIVYAAIEPITEKAHRKKWEPARREFFAGTLS